MARVKGGNQNMNFILFLKKQYIYMIRVGGRIKDHKATSKKKSVVISTDYHHTKIRGYVFPIGLSTWKFHG